MKNVIKFWVAVIMVALAFAATGRTFAGDHGGDKPWICHPVNGRGELGNGWNLISPDHASSHINEALYPNGVYWMHMSNDGLRHDQYAVYGHCPGDDIPETTEEPVETTEPEVTIPETTEPETTVVETTEPETTIPETTEPTETTEETTPSTIPETTEPEQTTTTTVAESSSTTTTICEECNPGTVVIIPTTTTSSTLPESSTTSSEPTTSVSVTSTSVSETTTTLSPPSPTTTTIQGVTPPPSGPSSSQPETSLPTPEQPNLPETGSALTWVLIYLAGSILVVGGAALAIGSFKKPMP